MRPIDADALKEYKCSVCENRERCEDRETVCSDIAEIDEQPTIEAEPVKRGRWDTHDVVKILASGRTLDGFCQCEACGSIFPFCFSEYSFCPNCGARMDGDKT